MKRIKPGDAFYHFIVERRIGSGGHGVVFLIRHRETNAPFALKVMRDEDLEDPNKSARALSSAKGNDRIEHRNVVRVFDLNREADGMVWLRTEFLRGCTLQELISRRGRLSLPFALGAAIEAAHGLHAIHEAQVIHRDVKPSNLFYEESGSIKVIDLSVAKVFLDRPDTTVGRQLLGTPAYTAPEVFDGATRPDVRLDIYGLGITLFEMLAGRHPFADALGNNPEMIKRHLVTMPPKLAAVARLPARVDDIVQRAVAKDPALRHGSAMELARDLAELRAWADTEARMGRLVIVVPPGEPPAPGTPDARSEYRPPELPPMFDAPASTPSARVIVGDAKHTSAEAVADTFPLGVKLPVQNTGPAGTLPLDTTWRSEGIIKAGPTAVLPAQTTSQPPSRETPLVSSRSMLPPRRSNRAWVVSACAVVVSGGVVSWLHRSGAPTATEPQPAVAVQVTASASAPPSASIAASAVLPTPPVASSSAPRRAPQPAPPRARPRPVAPRQPVHRAPFQVED